VANPFFVGFSDRASDFITFAYLLTFLIYQPHLPFPDFCSYDCCQKIEILVV